MIRALLSACLLALATPAIAQNPALLHFNRMRLVVEDMSGEAAACGITKPVIRQAFMYPVSSSKLQIASDGDTPFFYIQIITVRVNNFACASALYMQVANQQLLTPNFGEKLPVWAPVELWSKSWITASPIGDHPHNVIQIVETAAKMFITDWNLANK